MLRTNPRSASVASVLCTGFLLAGSLLADSLLARSADAGSARGDAGHGNATLGDTAPGDTTQGDTTQGDPAESTNAEVAMAAPGAPGDADSERVRISGEARAERPQGRRSLPGVAQWVDDDLCVDCHPAETISWRGTGMARALEPLKPGELADLAAVEEAETGYSYRFEEDERGGRLVETNPAADPAHEKSWPIGFAIGAGDLDRSYAIVAHGRWWFAPLEVVSAHETRTAGSVSRHAALAPPHEMQPGSRDTLPVTPECLACHTEALPPLAWPLNTASPKSEWEPRGISCGACHANASQHALWRELDLSGEEVDGTDPLLIHGQLEREERMSICAACHLQGDARLELIPDRFTIPEPGGDLLELRAVYVAKEISSAVGFASHVERLVESACYLESGAIDGGMVCETCHDPHRSVYEPAEQAQARAACLKCHAGEHAREERPAAACALPASEREGGRDCADCHLPEAPVFDVGGVRIHDHWIQKRPEVAEPPDELRFEESPEGRWRRFQWPGVEPPAHVADAGLDMMALASRGHVSRALALAHQRPGSGSIRLPMYHHVRAGLLETEQSWAEAERAYRVALALDPGLASASTNLGLLLVRTGRAQEALELLSALLEKHPLMDSALRNRALAYGALGDEEAYVRDLEHAFRLRSDAALALAIAGHYESKGDPARADRWRSAARSADPLLKEQ